MKKKSIIPLLLVALLIASIFHCCKDDKSSSVPFTSYALPETCGWSGFDVADEPQTFLINNESTLNQHLGCGTNTLPHSIDFESNSLLVLKGFIRTRGGHTAEVTAVHKNGNTYTIDVDVWLGFNSQAGDFWTASILIPKVTQNSTYIINPNYIDNAN